MRLRQIVRAATAPGRGYDGSDHKRMQIARLTPALRLAADGVAQGDAKSIPLLLQIIDRLDRYSNPLEDFSSPELFRERRRPSSARRGKPAGNENRRRRPRPIRRGASRMPIAKRATA